LLWLLVIDLYLFTSAAGPAVAAICAAVCLPTTAFGLFVVRRLDRNEKEPWRLVLVAFAWGAIVATSMVIWGESFWTAIAERVLVPGPGLDASTAFSAGLLEELAKGTAVLLLFLVMRNEFDDVVDGIVYGAAIGLGFNFLESIAYMTNLYSIFSPDGIGGYAAGFQWYSRQVLGLFFGHATYTALIGAGIGIARQLHNRRQQVIAVASGFLIAIAGHFSWDAWIQFFPIESSTLGLVEIHLRTLIMTGPFTALVIALLLSGLRYEGQALREQLQGGRRRHWRDSARRSFDPHESVAATGAADGGLEPPRPQGLLRARPAPDSAARPGDGTMASGTTGDRHASRG
jgi:RsiW-degrading membrane proteinase PrsW (M82 family)